MVFLLKRLYVMLMRLNFFIMQTSKETVLFCQIMLQGQTLTLQRPMCFTEPSLSVSTVNRQWFFNADANDILCNFWHRLNIFLHDGIDSWCIASIHSVCMTEMWRAYSRTTQCQAKIMNISEQSFHIIVWSIRAFNFYKHIILFSNGNYILCFIWSMLSHSNQ